jgi:hypothetical protein
MPRYYLNPESANPNLATDLEKFSFKIDGDAGQAIIAFLVFAESMLDGHDAWVSDGGVVVRNGHITEYKLTMAAGAPEEFTDISELIKN